MLFSIITATYNAKDFISKTIDSVLAQNSDEILAEHVIIDGGSTDGTVQLIEEYSRKYPDVVRYISEPDDGIFDAMNKGIRMARGMYLNFQGAGDYLWNGDVCHHIKGKISSSKEIIYANVHKDLSRRMTGEVLDCEKLIRSLIMHTGMFYHNTIFAEYGLYEQKYPLFADYAYNLKLFADKNLKKTYVDSCVAGFKEDGISTRGIDDNFAKDFYDIVETQMGSEYARIAKLSGREFFFVNFATGNDYIVLSEPLIPVDDIRGEILQKVDLTDDKYVDKTLAAYTQNSADRTVKILVATYEDGTEIFEKLVSSGISVKDILFFRKVIFSSEMTAFLENMPSQEVYIAGAGNAGKYVSEVLRHRGIGVKGFLDNDSKKWGSTIHKIPVKGLDSVKNDSWCVIASDWKKELKKQLLDVGMHCDRIITA